MRARSEAGQDDSTWRSPIDEIEQEPLHARVATLTEPEDRLLPEVAVGIVRRDVHQLVDGFAISALRENEYELILNLGLAAHLVVQRDELAKIGTVLAGPEQS